jgi:urease accessory protein
MTRFLGFALFALALLPTAALAHTGVGSTHGFSHGFIHPLGGLDHQLAMVMVGIFAWQLGGRALWMVPATFVLVMALGGVLGIAGVPVPSVEIGIALSVVILGAVVAFGVKAPLAVAMGVVGLSAVFHGHAHGSEMPMDASGASFAAVYMFATALHLGLGIAIGFITGRIGAAYGNTVYRVAGGAASLAGVAILTGYL